MGNSKCLFCSSPMQYLREGESHTVECPVCRKYKISGTAIGIIRIKLDEGKINPRQLTNICAWLRNNQIYEITSYNIDSLIDIKRPNISDICDNLLFGFCQQSDFIGCEITFDLHDRDMQVAAWAINDDELYELISYLKELDYIEIITTTGGNIELKILQKGWIRFDKLQQTNIDSQQGFVAMWFADEVKTSFELAIEPAIRDAGYIPHRVDQREHNDKIDDEIIVQIRKSRFIVADFTGHRGGVYYEAGYAKGLGLEVFWTCRDDHLKDLHFDIRQHNTIVWNKDNVEDFRKKLALRIEAVLGPGKNKKD